MNIELKLAYNKINELNTIKYNERINTFTNQEIEIKQAILDTQDNFNIISNLSPDTFEQYYKKEINTYLYDLLSSSVSLKNMDTKLASAQKELYLIKKVNVAVAKNKTLIDLIGINKYENMVDRAIVNTISQCNPDFIIHLLNKGYNIANDSSIIIQAISKGNKDLFDAAIKSGTQVNGRENDNLAHQHPLNYSIRFNNNLNYKEKEELNSYFMESLLEYGADINKLKNNNSFLIYSILSNDFKKASWFLKKGAEIPDTVVFKGKETSFSSFIENKFKDKNINEDEENFLILVNKKIIELSVLNKKNDIHHKNKI